MWPELNLLCVRVACARRCPAGTTQLEVCVTSTQHRIPTSTEADARLSLATQTTSTCCSKRRARRRTIPKRLHSTANGTTTATTRVGRGLVPRETGSWTGGVDWLTCISEPWYCICRVCHHFEAVPVAPSALEGGSICRDGVTAEGSCKERFGFEFVCCSEKPSSLASVSPLMRCLGRTNCLGPTCYRFVRSTRLSGDSGGGGIVGCCI